MVPCAKPNRVHLPSTIESGQADGQREKRGRSAETKLNCFKATILLKVSLPQLRLLAESWIKAPWAGIRAGCRASARRGDGRAKRKGDATLRVRNEIQRGRFA